LVAKEKRNRLTPDFLSGVLESRWHLNNKYSLLREKNCDLVSKTISAHILSGDNTQKRTVEMNQWK
jgi:hypothetical protein